VGAVAADRLGREEIEEIAFGRRAVAVGEAARARVEAGHRELREALAAGGPVYGVTTGQGYLAGHALTEPEARAHQRNLLLGRAVGSAPWLAPEEVRALIAVRLARFLGGRAGVSPELCDRLAQLLDAGLVPAVPRESIGCAGEVIPLAHAFQVLVGVGRVLGPDGGTRPAAEALAERGVPLHELRPKEGIALLAGCPGTTALALARRRGGALLAAQAMAAAACSIDAAGIPLEPYEPAVGRLVGDPGLEDVLERLAELLRGARPARTGSQAPVSFRVAPQVLTHLERVLGRLGEDIDRGLRGSDDSPALVAGRFISTGSFHEAGLAAGMDALSAALARTGEVSAQRVHRLLDGRVTGLPDQLTPVPGPRCGLVVLHKRAVGAVHELRRLATPASLGAVDTSLGQEDAQSFGFAAAEASRRALRLTREVVAIEMIAARQAWFLRGRGPGAGLAAVAAPLTELVPPVEEDRPLGEDVDRIVEHLEGDGRTSRWPDVRGRSLR
jgi:histidine ammonia-lyase